MLLLVHAHDTLKILETVNANAFLVHASVRALLLVLRDDLSYLLPHAFLLSFSIRL